MAALFYARAIRDTRWRTRWTFFLLVVLTGCCSRQGKHDLCARPEAATLREIMARRDRILLLSSPRLDPGKPVLVVLHGATEDPTEMMEIVRECSGTHNVLLYVYNHHRFIRKLASDFNREMELLRERLKRAGADADLVQNVSILTFSFSAAVFRQAVLLSKDSTLYACATVIQIVPTAGGSYLARGMGLPLVGPLVSLASKPSAAENPYGRISARLWGDRANQQFYRIINFERVHSILVEGDPHSLAQASTEELRKRYRNGVGPNITFFAKSTGVVHEYAPSHPAVVKCVRRLLDSSAAAAQTVGKWPQRPTTVSQ